MSGNTDKIIGKAKQAAGDISGNDDLEREGERDEAAGNIKEGVDDAKDSVNDAVDSIKDKLN